MSATTATRSLLAGLIDDAAVFPPGNLPVAQAWSEHLGLRTGPYAELLGPLLVGASHVGELVEAVAASPAPEHVSPVRVAVVGRSGAGPETVVAGVRQLQDCVGLEVVGVEVVHDPEGHWREVLGLGLRVAVEVPREGKAMVTALDELARAAGEGRPGTPATSYPPLVAKLRTQAAAEVPAPTPRQLTEFLTAVRDRDLPFKLTGGLHQAAAHGQVEDGSFEHGFLNVLVAVHHLVEGASLPSLQATLEVRDAEALASLAGGLSEQEALDLRAAFVSFGCCGVTDPLDALAELGLLHEPTTV